jgi:hypothetical protein
MNVQLLDAAAAKYSELTLSTQNSVDAINASVTQISAATAQEPPRPSYSGAISRGATCPAETPTDTKIANRIALKECQILIEFNADTPNPPTSLSHEAEATLKAKALQYNLSICKGLVPCPDLYI